MEPVYAAEADDDTHICLKCRLTINGLENYVAHRKSRCYPANRFRPVRPSDDEILDDASVRPETISPIENNDACLKADDFFSLLELQSSSKKQGGHGFGSKTSAGVVTRSKASATLARGEQSLDQPRTSSFLPKPVAVLGSFHAEDQNPKVLSDPNLVICNLTEGDDEEFDELKDAGCPPSKDVGKWKPGGIGESPTPWTTPLLDEEREFSWEFSAQDQTPGTWDPQIQPTQSGRYGRIAQSPSPTQTHKSEKSGTRVSRCSADNPPSNKQTASEQSAGGGVKIWKTCSEPPPAFSDGQWRPQYQVHEPPRPPPTVGGKWKPEQEEVVEAERQKSEATRTHRSKDENERTHARRTVIAPLPPPPPNHTRGKWAPGMESRVRLAMGLEPDSEHEGQGDVNSASPVRKSGSTVQYWCAPCKRRLSSRSLYERHLLSELHFKRTLPRRGSSEVVEQWSQPRPQRKRRREKAVSPPPISKPSSDQGLRPTGSHHTKPRIQEQPPASASCSAPSSAPEQMGSRCRVCGARVFEHQIGKHLVSHYHWRGMQRAMARATNKMAEDAVVRAANHMVLDNIHAVVRQAPFQCGVCRFYCNTSADFRDHWVSQMHREKESKVEGGFWCWPCDVMQQRSSDLFAHLTSPEHLEVEASLNRTLPVVVRRRRDQHCVEPGCSRRFRLNIQLRQHQKAVGHAGLLRCGACGVRKGSHIALQRHVITAHPVDMSKDGGPVFCARTQQLFPSAVAAAAAEAAAAAKSQHEDEVTSMPTTRPRRCPHCDVVLPSVTALCIHLDKRHPDLKIRCARCNAAFALPQQVTRHVRDGRCPEHLQRQLSRRQGLTAPSPAHTGTSDLMTPKATEEAPTANVAESLGSKDTISASSMPQASQDGQESLACASCPYRSDSKAELLYHELLHKGGVDSDSFPMRCPVENCLKIFLRATSLKCHIRTHFGERPFRCTSCPAAFTRRYTLAAHRRREHGPGGTHAKKTNAVTAAGAIRNTSMTNGDEEADEWADWRVASVIDGGDADTGYTQLCAVCGKCFRDRTTLRQHMATHSQKRFECEMPGCSYRTTSGAKLRRHQQSHSDERPFACDQCDFSTKSRALLQRHTMTHTGSRPYKCPQCPFSTRLSLHLRRHMRVHTGAKPYRCPHCSYQCNVMENLRKHVMSTKRHAGKKLYVCRECDDKEGTGFSTNSAKDIHTHLTTVHASKFATTADASAYILAGVYNPDADTSGAISAQQEKIQEVDGKPIDNDNTPDSSPAVEQVETVETVNVVRVEQGTTGEVVFTCPDGQVMSMLVLPAELI